MIVLRLNSETFPETELERSQFAATNIDVVRQESLGSKTPNELLARVDGLVVISAKVPFEVIETMKRCRVIARYGNGTDNVDVPAATRRGIVVTNVPGFCFSEVADHTMALVLAAARKLLLMDRHTRAGYWQARVHEKVQRIAGKRLGLIGFGNIAQEVARRASAFGFRIAACDPRLDHRLAQELQVEAIQLPTLLETSDFISLHVPLTNETFHMIGEPQLRQMKSNAILINTARGGLIDEGALVHALTEQWIAGAGLDVYESLPMFDLNPNRTDNALFHLNNVVLTPHSAACSEESLEQLMADGAREAVAVLSGRAPSHWVNPTVIPRFPLQASASEK
jgi:D-3-phosphoglycerate dehydrogenase / 2-oxoglutarate reductase